MNNSNNYYLYFKEIYLGRLKIDKDNSLPKYSFICHNFNKAKEKYFFAGDGCAEFDYEMEDEKINQFSDQLPLFFQGLISEAMLRNDIVDFANITADDDDAIIIDKLANIDIKYGEFIFSKKTPESMLNATTKNSERAR